MRNMLKTTISLLALVSFLGLSSSAFGVASFARQTGLDCSSCHAATGFPVLSSFGQAFKAGGYVQGNEDNMIGDGDGLSIPASLNMSIVTKLMGKRNTSSVKAGDLDAVESTVGHWAVPDEAAIFLAGRVSKNTGFVLEHGDAHFNSFKITTVLDIGGGKLGIVPWMTDAFGPAWTFEILSTGAVRNLRDAEDRSAQNAQQKLGYAGAEETAGLGIYYWTPMFNVTVSPFTNGLEGDREAGTKFATYARLAVTPHVAGFDMGFGVQYYGGAAEADGSGNTYTTSAGVDHDKGWSTGYTYDMLNIDFQAMGEAGGMPIYFSLTYAMMGGDKAYDDYNIVDESAFDSTTGDRNYEGPKVSALGIALDLGVVPDKVGLMLGYTMLMGPASQDTGAATVESAGDTEMMLGLKYNVARNYRVQLEYTIMGKESTYTDDATSTATTTTTDKTSAMIMVFGSF